MAHMSTSLDQVDDVLDRMDELVVSVTAYGATGDGTTDDTAAFQAAIDANPGRVIYVPKAVNGGYRLNSTIFITTNGTCLVGQLGRRYHHGGTELRYYGTGPCIQIGTDNGAVWNGTDYSGIQSHRFENLQFIHSAPDTNLSIGASFGTYKSGSIGLKDWRGGGLVVRNVSFFSFETSFWGTGSDINTWDNVQSYYSHYGLYFGSHSDQQSVRDFLAVFNDTAITIDGARGIRIDYPQIVNCGNDTLYAVDIRKNSGSILFNQPWFESSGGYTGTDGAGFIAAGLNDGNVFGGSWNNSHPSGGPTNRAWGIVVRDPIVLNTPAGITTHKQCLVGLGAALGVRVVNLSPSPSPGYTENAYFDAVVIAPAGTSYAGSVSEASIEGYYSDSTAIADLFQDLGSGSPVFSRPGWGFHGTGAPTFRARKGSIYTRTDGTVGSGGAAGSLRYVNSTGSTSWVALIDGA